MPCSPQCRSNQLARLHNGTATSDDDTQLIWLTNDAGDVPTNPLFTVSQICSWHDSTADHWLEWYDLKSRDTECSRQTLLRHLGCDTSGVYFN